MLKICFSETPSKERWTLHGRLTSPWVRELRACWKKNHGRDKQRAWIVDLNEITFIDKSGERLLRAMVKKRAQFIAKGIYIKHVLEKLTTKGKSSVLNRLTGSFFASAAAVFAVLIGGATAKAQNTAITGSVPSGPASDQVLELTLRDAIKMALRYNLGAIESGQNPQIARGQRLLALSNLLPQVTPAPPDPVPQLTLAPPLLSS